MKKLRKLPTPAAAINPPPAYKTIIYPAEPWLAVPAHLWHKLPDGKIRATYPDEASLFWSVTMSQIAREVEMSRDNESYE